MKISFRPMLLLIALASSLIACPSDPPKPAETIFKPENAWNGSILTDAKTIPKEEFTTLVVSGELVIESSNSLAARNAALQKQYENNKTFLQNIPNKTPVLQALLDQAAMQPNRDGDHLVPGMNSQVLFGISTQLQEAMEIYQRSQSTDNALSDYTLSYALLPANLQSTLPAPNDLKGKTLAEIDVALVNLNKALAGQPVLKTARLEIGGATTASGKMALQAGNGRDNSGLCTATNYVSKYWFPLKNFVSQIKDQGQRGSCWAFTAIGAIESRERVQNNVITNLSEQFLVNKVKEDWDSSKYTDGYFADKALETAVSKGQVFPPEGSWTYNPARGRPKVEDNEDSYANTCDNYTGTCSKTSHQSERVCSTFVVTVCSYRTVTFAGPGIPSSRTVQIWQNGQSFDLNRYRSYLASGYVITASFPVYRGFMDDVASSGINAGVVSNYATTKFDKTGQEVAGSYGGHAVQIVGFLSNETLTGNSSTPVNIGGGGMFIIKNSWGCVADSGYYYVPADYVRSLFKSLSVLNFDSRRSDAWNKEQALPGSSIAPTIQVSGNTTTVDLRVGTELTSAFTVSHPVAKSVNLTIISDKDGQLYNGTWNTDPTSLNFNSFKYAFASVGARTINLVASFGGNEARANFKLNVFNSNPSVGLYFTGNPHQGEAFTLIASLSDINEPDLNGLCANTIWSVTAPDVLSATSGCQVKVTFGTTGRREVRVDTRDSEGLPSSSLDSVHVFNVLSPLVNPYPRITDFGVNSSELNGFGCYLESVPNGSSIDLRENGCDLGNGQPIPSHYFAAVAIENPSNENLTFDWSLIYTGNNGDFVGLSSNERGFSLDRRRSDGTNPNFLNCRIVVTINAPEASRSKTQTVWAGKCSHDPRPN